MLSDRQLLALMAASILAGRKEGAARAVQDAQRILEEIDRPAPDAKTLRESREYDEASHGDNFGSNFVHADGEESFLADVSR